MKASLPPSLFAILIAFISGACPGEEGVFPHRMPDTKPDIPLSAAMKRTGVWHKPEVYFRQSLSQAQRARIAAENRRLVEKSPKEERNQRQ